MFVISGFGVGIFLVNTVLPSGFIPLEDQGMIYGILQTPPGSTLEYTNSKSTSYKRSPRKSRASTRSLPWPVTKF